MYQQSESIGALAAALAKAQGQIESVPRNAKNPHLGNKYADLASIRDAVRGPLAANELAVTQMTMTTDDGGLSLRTMLMHSSGEWVASTMAAPKPEAQRGINAMQAMGSSISYLRRYALSAILGLATDDDDDGHAAGPARGERQQEQRQAPPRREQQQAPAKADWVSYAERCIAKCNAKLKADTSDDAAEIPKMNEPRLLNAIITTAIEDEVIKQPHLVMSKGKDGEPKRDRAKMIDAGNWLLANEKTWTDNAVKLYLSEKIDEVLAAKA